MKTVRLTMGQALVKFLDIQFVSFDGEGQFVHGVSQQSDLPLLIHFSMQKWAGTISAR